MYLPARRLLLVFDFCWLLVEGCSCLGGSRASRHALGFLRQLQAQHRNGQRSVGARPHSGSPVSADSSSSSNAGYYGSSHYRRVSGYFSAEEKSVECEVFAPLKNAVALRSASGDGYVPAAFDVRTLSTVPELFQESFRRRNEDHWSTLIQIRTLYLEKQGAEETFAALSERRSELAKQFHLSNESERASLRAHNLSVRNEAKSTESLIKTLSDRLQVLVDTLPNVLADDVPDGSEVIVEKTSPELASLDPVATVVPHHEVLERFSYRCASRSIEISGTGFSAFSGDISRLERALTNYLLDTHTKLFGYTEFSVPFVVSESTLNLTGHLPRFECDLFKLSGRHQCNGDRGYLIPTGEIPLLALFGNSRIASERLPVWASAHTPCFRSEIQDYGRDTRGLIRNHQFGKVELICLCAADRSDHFHRLMSSHIEFVLEALELPYRRVVLPASQLGATSSKTIDFEVFFPSLGKYVEVSSCSNTRDYQSGRLNLLTTSRSQVHCINGSGLAIGRTLSAILESYQSVDENSRLTLRVPKVLQPYLAGQCELREPVSRC